MSGGKHTLHTVAWWLLWVGGINWGLIGLFDYNLVDAILGTSDLAVKVVYVLVGLSALLLLGCCPMGKCKMGKKK